MSYKIVLSAAIAAMIAPSAFAQSLTGASISGDYRNYFGDDADGSSLSLEGGAEVSLGNSFAVGANLSFGKDNDTDADYTNGTLHALYMVSPTAAVGGFVARDSVDNADSTNYGIEFGGRSNTSRYEIYYGATDLSGDNVTDEDLTIFGASFDVQVTNGISLGLGYESFTGLSGRSVRTGELVEDVTFSDTSIIARYNVMPNASVYGKLGKIAGNAFEGDTTFFTDNDVRYVGVGAEFTFGGQRGPIFGERTLSGFGF
jgi:hypothetical protein